MHFNSPFFILGNPRSGTSLFRLMLNNHPSIVVPPECGFIEWLFDEFSCREMNINTYRDFVNKVINARKFETWGLSAEDLQESILEIMPNNYQELVAAVNVSYAKKCHKEANLFGDKNNYYINNIQKIEKIFPNCKKIFIIRDGRDVACSYLELKEKIIDSKYKPKLTKNIKEIANEWCHSVEIMKHWLNNGAISIRYEDLVTETNSTLTKVCKYLNVTYSDKMLDYYKNNDEPDEFKAWKGKTFEPVAKTGVGRYKNDLTHEELIDFEIISREALTHAGYKIESSV